MNGSWDAYPTSPADFARVDDIITDFATEREPGIEIGGLVTSNTLPGRAVTNFSSRRVNEKSSRGTKFF